MKFGSEKISENHHFSNDPIDQDDSSQKDKKLKIPSQPKLNNY